MDKQTKRDIDFEKIYDEYRPVVAFIAATYLEDKTLVDDVIQEVFLNLFKNFNNVKNIKSYLSVTTKNTAISFDKQNKRTIIVDTFDSLAYEEMKNDNDLDFLLTELQEILSNREIDIIICHLIDGLSFKEIAKSLKIKEPTVKTTYYRALKKCKKGGLLK